jgi:RHS repeat-associated protein
MRKDDNKGITTITYNHLNLPIKITFASNSTIEYLYDAEGKKLQKKVMPTGNPNPTTTKYMDGFQYINDVLQFFPSAEGYIKKTANAYQYVYNYTDHLGNVRLSYSDIDGGGSITPNEILEESSYYPFGLKHSQSGVTNTQPDYKYKYNGKEYQDELGLNMYDYGARNYDPALGRWMNIDPKAEVSRRWSTYSYCYNNPVRFVDPDGMMASDPGDLYNLKGQHIGYDGVKDNAVYLVHTNSNKQLSESESKNLVAGTIAPGLAIGPKVEQKAIGNDELNLRASLSTLKQTEAGTANAPLDYNSWNMGDNFTEDSYAKNPDAYADHPGMNTEGGGGTAAGAYQSLERFYTGTDFSPQSQDAAAVNNMTSSSFSAAKSGSGADFKTTTQGRWTSLKHFTAEGVQNLIDKYRAQELKGNSSIATPVGQLVETRR